MDKQGIGIFQVSLKMAVPLQISWEHPKWDDTCIIVGHGATMDPFSPCHHYRHRHCHHHKITIIILCVWS
jgi:hypothetical protein